MKTREEIVASKLYDLLSDSRLEHYLVGRYIAQSFTTEAYDRFRDVVISARQEKEDRVEWLKKTILGDDEMTTFDNMCTILYDFHKRYGFDTREEIANFIKTQNLGIPLAIAYCEDWVSDINQDGRQWVEQCFVDLLELLDLDDNGWTDLIDIENASNLQPE